MSNVKLSSLKLKLNGKNGGELQGSKTTLQRDYGGLGTRYYNLMGEEIDKILQVDIETGLTETKGSVRGRGIQLALEMQVRGLGENDIIVICSRNHADQTIAVLATLFLGAIVAPLDPDLSYRESLEFVRKLKPKMCFCDIRAVSQMERIIANLNLPTEIINFGMETNGSIQYSKLFTHKEDEAFYPTFIENPKSSVAFILPTQGTSSNPKLVCLSHQNIYIQTLIFLEIFQYPDKVISFFPLSWFLQTILTCVSFESTMIRILPTTFSERTACKIIHDFGIGYAIFGTDYAMRIIGNVAIKDFDLNCLKSVMIGIVNTTKHDIKQLRMMMPQVKFLQCYCLTETGCIAASTIGNYEESLEKSFTVGRLSMNSKIRIVDMDSKETLGPEKLGELYFTGDGIMLGYFKDNDGTLASMDRGYFKTGDLAMYDEEGWVYVKGRIEDLIQMEDYRLCPIELEEIILAHPLVKDVVVIGSKKEILACVKKKPSKILTADKLMKHISERVPERHRPTRIVFLDRFPRTAVGNVKKWVLKENFFDIKIGYTSSLASIDTYQKAVSKELVHTEN